MKVKVTYLDYIEADTIEEAWRIMMDLCAEMGAMRDVTPFEFEPLEDE